MKSKKLQTHPDFLKNFPFWRFFKISTYLFFRPLLKRKLFKKNITILKISRFEEYLEIGSGIHWVKVKDNPNEANVFLGDRILANIEGKSELDILKQKVPQQVSLSFDELQLLSKYYFIRYGEQYA